MSQTGKVAFFHNRPMESPRETVSRLLKWSGTEKVSSVTRYEVNPRTRQWSRNTYGGGLVHVNLIPPLFDKRQMLCMDCGAVPRGLAVRDAIVQTIPTDIRRDFAPGDLSIVVGPHRAYDSDLVERSQAKRMDAQLSIGFFGYSVPIDAEEFERQVFQLPIMQKYRTELEEIVGPLQTFCEWSY